MNSYDIGNKENSENVAEEPSSDSQLFDALTKLPPYEKHMSSNETEHHDTPGDNDKTELTKDVFYDDGDAPEYESEKALQIQELKLHNNAEVTGSKVGDSIAESIGDLCDKLTRISITQRASDLTRCLSSIAEYASKYYAKNTILLLGVVEKHFPSGFGNEFEKEEDRSFQEDVLAKDNAFRSLLTELQNCLTLKSFYGDAPIVDDNRVLESLIEYTTNDSRSANEIIDFLNQEGSYSGLKNALDSSNKDKATVVRNAINALGGSLYSAKNSETDAISDIIKRLEVGGAPRDIIPNVDEIAELVHSKKRESISALIDFIYFKLSIELSPAFEDKPIDEGGVSATGSGVPKLSKEEFV